LPPALFIQTAAPPPASASTTAADTQVLVLIECLLAALGGQRLAV
jgi:hypothetical protein